MDKNREQELMAQESLYKMKLLETLSFGESSEIKVMRVPGGWIINKAFVPYDVENKPDKNDLELIKRLHLE